MKNTYKYKDILNDRSKEQILKHVEVQQRVLNSVKQNRKCIHSNSPIYKRVINILEHEETKTKFKQLFK